MRLETVYKGMTNSLEKQAAKEKAVQKGGEAAWKTVKNTRWNKLAPAISGKGNSASAGTVIEGAKNSLDYYLPNFTMKDSPNLPIKRTGGAILDTGKKAGKGLSWLAKALGLTGIGLGGLGLGGLLRKTQESGTLKDGAEPNPVAKQASLEKQSFNKDGVIRAMLAIIRSGGIGAAAGGATGGVVGAFKGDAKGGAARGAAIGAGFGLGSLAGRTAIKPLTGWGKKNIFKHPIDALTAGVVGSGAGTAGGIAGALGGNALMKNDKQASVKTAGALSSDMAAARQHKALMDAKRESLPSDFSRRIFDSGRPYIEDAVRFQRAQALDPALKDELKWGGGAGLAAGGAAYAGLGAFESMKKNPALRVLLAGLIGATTGVTVGNTIGNTSYNSKFQVNSVM